MGTIVFVDALTHSDHDLTVATSSPSSLSGEESLSKDPLFSRLCDQLRSGLPASE